MLEACRPSSYRLRPSRRIEFMWKEIVLMAQATLAHEMLGRLQTLLVYGQFRSQHYDCCRWLSTFKSQFYDFRSDLSSSSSIRLFLGTRDVWLPGGLGRIVQLSCPVLLLPSCHADVEVPGCVSYDLQNLQPYVVDGGDVQKKGKDDKGHDHSDGWTRSDLPIFVSARWYYTKMHEKALETW